MKERIDALESPEAVDRYNILKNFGRKLFANNQAVEQGNIGKDEVELAKEFLLEGATKTNPSVWSVYWEHVMIAPQFGRQIADQAVVNGLKINPDRVEFLLWDHDISRLILPSSYLRNDFVGDRLFTEIGWPNVLTRHLPSTAKLMAVAEGLHLDEDQLKFQNPLNQKQTNQANVYFESLLPEQRIINFADNLGKRGENGLFDTESFIQYLRSQESRYKQKSNWPSVDWALQKNRRQAGAVLQAETIIRTSDWLNENGVNLDLIHENLKDYGPKFVVIVRHGELENPNHIVYNRDNVMKPTDIIHLAESGKAQMRGFADLLISKKFKVTQLTSSPEIRAQESTAEIANGLKIDFGTSIELDDNYAPGPYQQHMTLEDLSGIQGNIYEGPEWQAYNHESPETIIKRMEKVIRNTTKQIKTGEAGVLVSHGDPIAWIANTLRSETIPSPSELRELIYPAKGEGILVVIAPDDEILTLYLLGDVSTTSKSHKY